MEKAAVALTVEHSAPDGRSWVRALPGETVSYTLMSPGACKIRRGCNTLLVAIEIIPLGYQSGGAIPSVVDQNCNGILLG